MKYIIPNQKRYAAKITSRRMGLGPQNNFRTTAYMADIMNVANCESPDSVFNTGVPLCDVKKKKIKAVIFVDSGVELTGGDISTVAAFIAKIKSMTYAARGGRAYPIWDLLNFEDNTGDPATGSTGNLTTATTVTSDAVPAFRFGYNGTEARHARMSAMNSMSLDVFFVDDAYTVYGTLGGNGGFAGFSVLQAYADTSKFPVSDTVNQYSFRITLGDITQYRDASKYIVANNGLTAAVGLQNVQMVFLSGSSNVKKIQIIVDGGTNLEPIHGAAIAGLTFTAKNLETGAAFTVTSVADDTSLDALTVTLDSTAWSALNSEDRVQIDPPSAAALAAAGVKPFELLPVIVTKP